MWLWLILLIAVVVIACVVYNRTATHTYTAGKNIFKNSKYNLEEKEKNIADHNYFDDGDKFE